VEQLTELRKEARQSKVFVKVAKNTLVSRAVEGTGLCVRQDALIGPMLYAFSEEDPGAAGRLVKEFSKANDKLVAKVVAIGGQMYPGLMSRSSHRCRPAIRPCNVDGRDVGADHQAGAYAGRTRRQKRLRAVAAIRDRRLLDRLWNSFRTHFLIWHF